MIIRHNARLFSEFFCDSKTDIHDPSPPTAHRNATALPPEKDPPLMCRSTFGPGIAQAVTGRGSGSDYKLLRLQEQAGDPRSDPSSGQFAGELQEEPPLFHFQQRQRNSVGQRIAERPVAGELDASDYILLQEGELK